MKTPDEIKKGLYCCSHLCGCLEGCPYEADGSCENADGVERDALAYIQQLEAKVPKWISVKESLPEKHRRVLGVYCMGVFEMYYDGKYWRIDEMSFDTVTHWMPLPEPPEV